MIIITRDSGYADRLRKYKILIDGTEIGEISDGETKSFDISAGTHSLQLKIDWAKSNIINFTQTTNEDLKFKVTSPLRGKNIIKTILYSTIFSNKYLNLEQIV